MKVRNFLHILAVSAALAGYSAWVSSRGEKESSVSAQADNFPGTDIPLLNVAEAEALWRKSSTLFVDVRPYPDYEFGHIQGAINLPEEEFDTRFAALKPQLEQAEAIVVYCKNADCGKSIAQPPDCHVNRRARNFQAMACLNDRKTEQRNSDSPFKPGDTSKDPSDI